MQSTRITILAFVPAMLSLGAGKLPDVRGESQSVFVRAEDDVEQLAAKLKDPKEEERRQAVAALARVATPVAWNYVIEALADPSGLVADEAQLQLGESKEASIAKALYGKSGLASGDRQVRLRVAEALGRVKFEVDGSALCKQLADKDAELRRTIAWTIERLALANGLEHKSKSFVRQQLDASFKKDQDDDVRAVVLQARHAVEHMSASDVFEALSKRDAGVVRASATRLMGRVQVGQLAGLFDDSLESEEVCARRALVDEFALHASRATAISLANMLDREHTMRLAWTIVGRLQELSKETAELDREHWLVWMRRLAPDWEPPRLEARGKETSHERGAVAKILGQPLLSDHIAILIDNSPALSEKRADGKSRKEQLGAEIRRTLEIAPATAFNLIAYGSEPAAFEKGLVPATPANVKRALKFFEDCKPSGSAGGSFWEAAALASADARVDTILVVTNEPPKGARHANAQLIVELLAARNRFRQIVFDTTLLGGDKSVTGPWTRICADSGGRLHKFSLD